MWRGTGWVTGIHTFLTNTLAGLLLCRPPCLLAGSAGRVEGIEQQQSSSLVTLAKSVQSAAPAPVFSLMLAFDQPLQGVPFDSASIEAAAAAAAPGSVASSSSGSSFQWVACNSSKPGRSGGGGGGLQTWVAVTTPARTAVLLRQHDPLALDGGRFSPQTRQYQAAVAAQLLLDFRALLQPFCQVGAALPRGGGRGKGRCAGGVGGRCGLHQPASSPLPTGTCAAAGPAAGARLLPLAALGQGFCGAAAGHALPLPAHPATGAVRRHGGRQQLGGGLAQWAGGRGGGGTLSLGHLQSDCSRW